MLDRKFILQNVDAVKTNCEKRGVGCDIDAIITMDEQRKSKLQQAQELNRQANEVSKKIKGAASQEERNELIERGRQLRQEKDAAQKEHDSLDEQINDLQRLIPNMTHPDVPVGGEKDAAEIGRGRTEVPVFDFPVKDHVELGQQHDLFDFEAGARVAGAGFYYLKNDAVRLDMALQLLALDRLQDHGFTPVTTPDLAHTSILHGIGFNPRGEETQIYSIANTDLNLVATAEITLGGMMADQVIDAAQLPIKLCGLSHCFRTEAGAAGRATRGLYRVHQFSKVEMFAFCAADHSHAIHEEMREIECQLFDALEIPYRILDIPTGDLGGPAYRKYDLEAWMPGRGEDDGNGPTGEWG
ncbi:MAG: serine--tRNA ligase, partial [Planctomycetota bacterium]